MSSSTSVTSTPTDIRSSSSSSPGVAISAYSFGFLLISVVSLFIIISCCFVRCRSGAFPGTSWDTTEQLDGRGGRRRKLVPPVLWDAWLSRPPASTKEVLGAGQFEWSSIQVCTSVLLPFVSDNRFQQPVYVSLIHACCSRSARQFAVAESEVPADHSTAARPPPDDSQPSSPLPPRRRFAFLLAHPFNFHMWPRRRSRTHHRSAASEKPTEDETENHPEAVKIAVMISMPSSAFRCWNHGGGPSCQSTGPDDALREYQIGVAQVPWIHGECTRC
ncbi:uncharacterized protein HD556DRAFT_812809 [Suillus plorans]|uniref:Uncharacterized protein n=1 Tax=Suillus plorans TaxID=116603 RepID=A0A9P7J4J8_9AGAM|nr:uncharacterized protein HD556DRAFT_812809 [Suillus plorans]KAG1802303.1 hypothetical protein HD556DRAFT_812809 [Suillus plorans]